MVLGRIQSLCLVLILWWPAQADEDTVLAQFIYCGTNPKSKGKPMARECQAQFLNPNSSNQEMEEKLAFLINEKPVAITELPCETSKPQSKCAEVRYGDGAKYLVVYILKDRKIESLSIF